MPSVYRYIDKFKGDQKLGDFTIGLAVENTGSHGMYAVSQLYGYTKRGETRWYKRKYVSSFPGKEWARSYVDEWKGTKGVNDLKPTRHTKIHLAEGHLIGSYKADIDFND